LGISNRGARYRRTLLIHGARSALRWAEGKPDRLLLWALKLKEAKGFNVAACALANKPARVAAWALLAHGRRYEAQWNPRPSTGDGLCYRQTIGSAFESTVRPTTMAKVKNERCPTGKTDAGILRSPRRLSRPTPYREPSVRIALWPEPIHGSQRGRIDTRNPYPVSTSQSSPCKPGGVH
jgi:hypothetical protein